MIINRDTNHTGKTKMADLTIILSSRFAYFFNESHHSYCFLSEMVWNWFSKRLNHVNIWSAESQTHITKTKMAEMSDLRLSFPKVLLSHYCKSMWVVDCPKLIWWVIWLRKSIIRRKTNCMLKIKMAELTDTVTFWIQLIFMKKNVLTSLF